MNNSLWNGRNGASKRGKLVREFQFSSFEEAILFVNRVAALAESRDHHPDIDIRYNHVVLSLISHDAKGLTTRDASLAEALDLAFSPTIYLQEQVHAQRKTITYASNKI